MGWVLALLVVLIAAPFVQHLRLTTGPDLPAPPANGLRLATWNVHYIWLARAEGRWGLAGWETRKTPMDALFKHLDADLIAFQEMESFARGNGDRVNLTRDWLSGENPGYAVAGIGPWREVPSTQPIFYRPDRLQPRDQGWFFFSETPEVIYSRGFDGAPPSFANWVIFETPEGARFRVINVHFDAGSRGNRRRSAELVADRARPWIEAGETVVLMGDLNALHGAYTHRVLAETGLQFTRPPGASFHLDRGLHLFGAIDHIGLHGQVRAVAGPFVAQHDPGPVNPSDHYPVVLDIVFADRPGTP